jgi:adenylate cyclase
VTTTAAPGRDRFVYTPWMLAAAGAVLALPLLGLLLLLRRPALDLHWEHHPAHFWLVLLTAALSAVLAFGTGTAAVRRGDARVLLVSLTFLSAAGFLGLHALATPGVLLAAPNAGFVVATPIGIALGSLFAVASSLDLSRQSARTVRLGRWLRLALVALMVLWAVLSLAQLPPLHAEQIVPEQAGGLLGLLAVPAIVLYAVAAVRYVGLWRRRPSLMLLSMLAAFVLLAEAMVAVVFARNWQLTWWEWHVLMLAAFGLVALGARVQWYEERFADLYLDDTVSGTREMSVLFADLQGFTTFSEHHEPAEVTAMLNTFFEVAVPPVVREYGGDIDRIIGDALMVTFNKRGDQPDHARRAAGAGLAIQEATARVVAEHPGWPCFRVGINSGPVSVSLLGTEGGRTHTVIGDTVNVASRIEGKAPGGGVAIGPGTKALLPGAHTESLGLIELKGKAEPLEVHQLIAVG